MLHNRPSPCRRREHHSSWKKLKGREGRKEGKNKINKRYETRNLQAPLSFFFFVLLLRFMPEAMMKFAEKVHKEEEEKTKRA